MNIYHVEPDYLAVLCPLLELAGFFLLGICLWRKIRWLLLPGLPFVLLPALLQHDITLFVGCALLGTAIYFIAGSKKN